MSRFLALFWSVMWLAHAGWNSTSSSLASVPTTSAPATTTTHTETAVTHDGFDADATPFALRFGDEDVRYALQGVFALPGEQVTIEAPGADASWSAEADGGELEPAGDGRWTWRAPERTGAATLVVKNADGATTTLHAFVMVPYGEMRQGKVRGYAVGAYPEPHGKYAARQARPRGFVQVDASTEDLEVSPHFKLSQFVCKSGEGYPKYIVLQPTLLVRLENLLATVNESGLQAHGFTVMSAYRTPQYNRAIGNTTTFTRHQYGDAADIYIDEDHDGRMDDLNHDGRHDKQDAQVLSHYAEITEGTPAAGGLDGGLAAYAPSESHGPFVHVDTRGYQARW